jgi:transposase
VWTVKARIGAVRALGRQLKHDGTEIVTLEPASDCWRIWFFVLEAAGLAVQLVSAAQARNLPGRPKTDKLDAMWLARLTEWGMLRPSFVPPKPIRELRDYTRARARLIQERTRCWQRLEKLLEGALVKLSSVVSKLTTLSAQDMIKAMIAGQRDHPFALHLACQLLPEECTYSRSLDCWRARPAWYWQGSSEVQLAVRWRGGAVARVMTASADGGSVVFRGAGW